MSGRCACVGCGLAFSSVSAFDAHRTGMPAVARRCLSVAELEAAGWRVTAGGAWTPHAPLSAQVRADLRSRAGATSPRRSRAAS